MSRTGHSSLIGPSNHQLCQQLDLSDSSTSSSSTPDSDSEPEWRNEVDTRGTLMYVKNESSTNPFQNQNGGFLIGSSQENLLDVDDRKQRTGYLKPTTKLKSLINKSKKHRSQVAMDPEDDQQVMSMNDYDVHEVQIKIKRNQKNLGRRASKSESMLGIVVGTRQPQFPALVHSFVPEHPAVTDDLRIGDWIRYVNNIEVDFNNVNRVLDSFTSSIKVKLTLYRSRAPNNFRSSGKVKDKSRGQMKVVSGQRHSEHLIDDELGNLPHIIMYLGSPSTHDGTEEDIKYEYPRVSSKLRNVRGLFYTLCNVMPDVTSTAPISSSLVYEGSLVHVCYVVEDHRVMVLAVPSQCLTLNELQQLCSDIVRVLRVEYETLLRAFEDVEHKLGLDDMFCEMFRNVLIPRYQDRPSFFLQRSFEESIGMSKLLPHLPEDLQAVVSDSLSELESADFSVMDDVGPRRQYDILGCCFHYKGHLIANHLPSEHLEDIHLILRFNLLLAMTGGNYAPVGQLIFWKEVHLTGQHDHVHSEDINRASQRTCRIRHFLLTVGMKYGLLSTLLEAGGFTQRASGYPGPNIFYVEKSKSTLMELHERRVFHQIEQTLENRSEQLPLANPHSFVQSSKSDSKPERTESSPLFKIFAKSVTGSSPSMASSSRNRSLTDLRMATRANTNIDSSSCASPSHGTGDDVTPILGRRHNPFDVNNRNMDLRSNSSDNLIWKYDVSGNNVESKNVFDLASLRHQLASDGQFNYRSGNSLLAGHENTLFHYLTVESSEGVLVSPTGPQNGDALQAEIIENFRRCCLIIHKSFEKSYKNKDKRRPPQGGGIFTIDSPMSHINEQGMLFNCNVYKDGKKQPSYVTYWVVGRQFIKPRPREIYVCYHDSASQNIVELAFKLKFI